MKMNEFKKIYGLKERKGILFDESGTEIARVCPNCKKIIPSGATLNCGRNQPEYCNC